ncbi:MAG: MMPL family transporter [Pirellulaceae bacterium]|nr:MMPL family transporter [Pirellulaceae bacterium]
MKCTERFVRILISGRWLFFAAAIGLYLVAYPAATQVRFDRSIERMFSPDDPLLPPYERLKRDFGGNEIVLVVYEDDGLLSLDGAGMVRLADVSARLRRVKGVRDVLSLAQVNELLGRLEQSRQAAALLDFLGQSRQEKWKGPPVLNPGSELARKFREMFAGYTHSVDGQTAAIVCLLEPAAVQGDGSDSRTATIQSLDEIVRNLPDGLPPGMLAGEPVMVIDGFELLAVDGARLGTWSLWLLGATILLCFRSVRWLVVPLVIVQWSLVVTRAALVWSGLALSMVSSMLTAIITVVAVATVMHIIVRFRQLQRESMAPRDALPPTLTQLAWPVVGAIATDVVGFGSLWCAQVGPVQDFGTMMMVGALTVLPAICLLFPSLALVGKRASGGEREAWAERSLGNWLVKLRDIVWRQRILVSSVTLIVTSVAAAGAWKLEVESDFTRNFRAESRVVKSYEFVETQLGGAGVIDVIVPAPQVLDAEYVARVRRLQQQLRKVRVTDPTTGKRLPALTKVISLVDALDAMDADPVLARFTPTAELRAQAMAAAMPNFVATLRASDSDLQGANGLRIMLRAHERQSAEQKRELLAAVAQLAEAEFPADHDSPGAEVTGFFVLLTSLIESMLADQWTTFGAAAAGIFTMLLLAFRSPRLAAIAMVPNALPIFVVLGMLGWLNLRINMGTAMIAAVSMGLSVDSSIHYLVSYQRLRRAGKSVAAALGEVQQSVGLAMVLSTLALMVGFSILVTSAFVPTVYFGALVTLTMLGGLAGNLIVLPLLLQWTERDSQVVQVVPAPAISR